MRNLRHVAVIEIYHPAWYRCVQGQWYIFLHNTVLSIGYETGAIGCRAAVVEYLKYNGTAR